MKVKINRCPKCHKDNVICEKLADYHADLFVSSGFVDGDEVRARYKCTACNEEFNRTLMEATQNGDEIVN